MIKMKKNLWFFALAMLAVSGAWNARSAEVIPLLKTPNQTLTNATVLEMTATHLFVRHAGGLSMVSLKDLEPALQKKLGYVPGTAEAIELAAQRERAVYRSTPLGSNSIKVNESTDTNALAARSIGLITKDYPVGKTGALSLAFPKLWKDSCAQATDHGWPYITVRFEPEFGSNVMVSVTSLPAKSSLKQMGAVRVLEMSGIPYLPASQEPALSLKALDGVETQGFVNIGDFALSFVILYDYPDCQEMRAAMQILQTARFIKPE